MNEDGGSSTQDLVCIRCARIGSKRLGLCVNCHSMFNRLRRTKYSNAASFTVQVYCAQHPLQVSRRGAMPQERSAARTLVPGFYLVGDQMKKLAERIRKVSLSDVSVLIEGETGVGKEGVAHAIHTLGSRAKRPFVPVNCAALPEGIAESEMFGHQRGSFTGSGSSSVGLFASAHQGTLFLDEVNSLPLSIQAKLLRTLDTGRVRPVGSTREEVVDVRVIAATNKNLEELCRVGSFREDLYYRLCAVTISVPPLRERRDEIPHLMRSLFSQVSPRSIGISDRAMEYFVRYAWPGNVREMKNMLKDYAIFFEGECIDSMHVPDKIKHALEQKPQRRSKRRPVERMLRLVPK